MTSAATPYGPDAPLRSQPSVRGYTVLALTGLMGMVLALVENDRSLVWVLVLAAFGAAGVVAHWRAAPPLLLLGLAVLDCFHMAAGEDYLGGPAYEETILMHAVLAASVLIYAAAQYRLVSLTHNIFPVDPRRPPPPVGRRPRPDASRGNRRSAGLPGPWEMPLLAIVAGAWAAGASLLWATVSAADAPLHMAAALWHALLLVFTLGLTVAVLAGAAAYLSWASATPDEHLLYLQDQLWRETRREQNRVARFLTWARLRAQRRKEKA